MKITGILKTLLVLLGGIALGFTVYVNLDTILRSARDGLSPIANALGPIITQILTTWNGIPDVWKTVIIGGIPTALMMFFAWTKTRAMQKLQQVQTESQQKLTKLSDVNQVLQGRVEAYQNMPKSPDLSPTVSALQTSLNEAQQIVTAKQTELSNARAIINEQKMDIQNLLKRIEELTPKPIP